MKEHIFRFRVYIDDTDCVGIVYHANYLKFFERARSEWAEQVGLGLEWQRSQGVLLAVRSAKMDFLQPAKVHQMVEVVSKVTDIRPASLIYEQYLRSTDTIATILCKAEIKVACVDTSFKPKGLPADVKILLGEEA